MYRTTYSSSLNTSSQRYCQTWDCNTLLFYYESLRLNVLVSGEYAIWDERNMNLVVYLYTNAFDPQLPEINFLMKSGIGSASNSFRLSVNMSTLQNYTLVVTTRYVNDMGYFNIFIQGPAFIELNRFETPGRISDALLLRQIEIE